MIYVDKLRIVSPTKNWKYKKSSHMLADSVEELHEFAKQLGMKREWFQPKSTPHYDLTEKRYKKALELGAKLVDRIELVAIIRKYRENDKE